MAINQYSLILAMSFLLVLNKFKNVERIRFNLLNFKISLKYKPIKKYHKSINQDLLDEVFLFIYT